MKQEASFGLFKRKLCCVEIHTQHLDPICRMMTWNLQGARVDDENAAGARQRTWAALIED
ncbi:hypothetical protein AXF42_Ash013598 [Apostasia shenzhenica]|uniref:Uncharacterized protein n=1 Tax=Apostasia shenzhenica TaxID=1088818 RepID=A0A2I0APD3_9ASPA|nr:hypothetical protein AXF42_Ash013598 [Apostasia shenzhenica]